MMEVTKLVNQVDAAVWAAEFMRIVSENTGIKLDEAFMTGWFANAIMAGYDKWLREPDNLRAEIARLTAENEQLKAEVVKYKSFWNTHFSEPINYDVNTVVTTNASTDRTCDIVNGVSAFDIMNKRKKGGE